MDVARTIWSRGGSRWRCGPCSRTYSRYGKDFQAAGSAWSTIPVLTGAGQCSFPLFPVREHACSSTSWLCSTGRHHQPVFKVEVHLDAAGDLQRSQVVILSHREDDPQLPCQGEKLFQGEGIQSDSDYARKSACPKKMSGGRHQPPQVTVNVQPALRRRQLGWIRHALLSRLQHIVGAGARSSGNQSCWTTQQTVAAKG
ncbi:unnamed protein product [Lampetra fluviatilis]